MRFRGIVFDFNGTLFWDTPLHNKAWDAFLEKHGISLTDQEKNEKIHGKYNQDIFHALFSFEPSEEQMQHFIAEKEGIYQSLCLKSGLTMAPGAIEFFEFLSDQNIPYTIATASGIENVDFYFEYLDLSTYFDRRLVIYNDGTFPGKPNPSIFLKAMEELNLSPKETIVFEDSAAGITSAEQAGSGKIIIVDSNGDDYSTWSYQVISDFSEVNRDLFRI